MNARTDHRPPAAARRRPASSRKSGFGGTLFGIFIGVALGLSLAAAVAFYLHEGGNPYRRLASRGSASREVAKEYAEIRTRRSRPRRRSRVSISTRFCRGGRRAARRPSAAARAAPTRPSRKSTNAAAQADKGRRKPPSASGCMAGSFASEADAEEPEGAARARGLGSCDSAGEPAGQGPRAFASASAPTTTPTSSTRMKSELAKRGFDVAVIK